jgi:hypothetical protein
MGLLGRSPINFLDAIWDGDEPSQIERVLEPLGKAISESAQRIDEAATHENPDYLESVVEEEIYIIEGLLGTAFVVCQLDITYTVSKVKALHSLCEDSKNIILTTTNGSKEGLLGIDPQIFPGTNLTQVQAIDAFANYFKHKDEWHKSWNAIATSTGNEDRLTRRTVQSIITAGAEEYSNGNFRGAAKKLGNIGYDNTEVFITILQTWRQHARVLYEAELGQKGLL